MLSLKEWKSNQSKERGKEAMKRIIIALLMSFVLIGQPVGVVNASEGLTNVKATSEEGSESNDVVVKKTVTWQDKTIEGNLYILENVDVTVDGKLTVNGNIYVWGTLTCNGRIECSGSLNCLYLKYGSMQFSAGGNYSGGKVYLNKGGSIGTMNVTSNWLTTNVPNPCNNGHKWDEGKIIKEATCITTGEKVYTCNVCGEIKTEEIPLTDHDIELQNVKDASCEENGYTGDKVCKKCHQVIKEGNVIPATRHSYGGFKTIIEATCEQDGEKEAVCSKCGDVKKETIKATGHQWNDGEITKEATCTEVGSKTYTCKNCGKTRTEDIPMIDHVIVVDKEVSATCTKDGLTEGKHCSICRKVLKKQEIIKATGHKADNGTITVKPTEDKTGVKTYKCTICGKILKEESIPATSKKDNTTTKPQTKPATPKPSIPSLKVGTKVTDKKTKAIYKVTGNNTVEYVKITSKAKNITIPSTITVNGVKYQVTSIAAKAFANNKKLTKVVIPASVRSIGKQAFSGCKNLKSIMIKTKYLTKKSVGAKAFKGIHAKATIKVPKKQKKAYQKMLKTKGIGKGVKVK